MNNYAVAKSRDEKKKSGRRAPPCVRAFIPRPGCIHLLNARDKVGLIHVQHNHNTSSHNHHHNWTLRIPLFFFHFIVSIQVAAREKKNVCWMRREKKIWINRRWRWDWRHPNLCLCRSRLLRLRKEWKCERAIETATASDSIHRDRSSVVIYAASATV